MSLISGINDFFGLDIGNTGVRVVQLKGATGLKTLQHYGFTPVDKALAQSDAAVDQQKIAQIIKELLVSVGITTNNVAVGLPSNKVFTTLVDMDRLEEAEIAKAIQYQADSLIPTPLKDSKLDWAVVGDSPLDKSKVEVLLTSVTNEYTEARLDMLESIGLNVIAFEPESLAMVRALIPPSATGLNLVLDIGSMATDLVVVLNGAPRLMRSIPTGSESIIQAARQNLSIEDKQAREFVMKFGLSKDKLEGQIYNAIVSTVDILISEVEKSIKFVNTRYHDTTLERIILTGGASTLPEFPLYMANKFNVSVEIGNAWRNVAFDPSIQNDLLAVSNHFAAAVGLAERAE